LSDEIGEKILLKKACKNKKKRNKILKGKKPKENEF
jgi:hypothetical protein